MAQNFAIDKEMKEIDSMIEYHYLDSALSKSEHLYQKLNSSKERKKYKVKLLELKYRQALIFDKHEKSPAEILQALHGLIDDAEAADLHSLVCRIYLLKALAYEKAYNYALTKKYINLAYKKIKENKLEEIYSTYCIRISSYYRYLNSLDSSVHYAKLAEKYAKIYHNSTDLNDAYLLLGNYFSKKKDYKKALDYYIALLNQTDKTNINIAPQFNNISGVYLKMKNYARAISYNDSAYFYYKKLKSIDRFTLPELRYKIYDAEGNTDSSYYYFKKYHTDLQLLKKEEEYLKTKKLEEQYQNDKKESIIKSKNLQMILIGSLLGVIICGSILLYHKNRKINHQNKIIGKQLAELTKTLEQKQILLSELQHRVKNNLQHVISILEIQKESVDFNNIDELIRGNQNRIHSMALLHKKLNVADNVNEVDLKKYIIDLAELVKDSYDNQNKKITLDINCELEKISLEKAFPIGLIVVELVSNSMKHAFKKRSIGIIHIEICYDGILEQNKLNYSDNGEGFDFNKTNEKGLGQEIIKGLIDQMDGNVVAKNDNGFELIIYFK